MHDTPTADGHAPHVRHTSRGLGIGPISALCERFGVDTSDGTQAHRMTFSRGLPTSPLEAIDHPPGLPATGTRIHLRPDR